MSKQSSPKLIEMTLAPFSVAPQMARAVFTKSNPNSMRMSIGVTTLPPVPADPNRLEDCAQHAPKLIWPCHGHAPPPVHSFGFVPPAVGA